MTPKLSVTPRSDRCSAYYGQVHAAYSGLNLVCTDGTLMGTDVVMGCTEYEYQSFRLGHRTIMAFFQRYDTPEQFTLETSGYRGIVRTDSEAALDKVHEQTQFQCYLCIR